MRGDFSWGFINKQEDYESEEDTKEYRERPCLEKYYCKKTQPKPETKVEEEVKEEEEVKKNDVNSKLNLKNIDLTI